VIALLIAAAVAAPSVSNAMRSDIPDAQYIPRYTIVQKTAAARQAINLSSAYKLRPAIFVTPNQPYASNIRLEIWHPSFVLGTADGGEAGVNFWGQHNKGHINIGLNSPSYDVRLLDCRILSPEPVHYKLYTNKDTPDTEGDVTLADGHLFLLLPAIAQNQPGLIELWPQSETAVMGFFGCDLSPLS
jgi:hypothetical protein